MLAVSILEINRDSEKIEKLDNLDFDYLHIDVMDQHFVSNITPNYLDIKKILKKTKHPLDIHFMTKDLVKYIDQYKELNPEYMTFHIEATNNPVLIIEHIKKNNIKVGISIKPSTNLQKIKPYLSIVDLVLVMSVEPGFGKQSFIDVTDKIEELKKIRELYQYHYLIEIDGGINNKTASLISDVDIAVVGSYITLSSQYQKAIDNIKKIFK